MKKRVICALALVLVLSMLLCACGNMGIGPGNFSFKHIHFSDSVGESYCATIERWYDNETGIEVKTEEYGAMYLAEGLYTLFESAKNCPYCK